MNIEKQLETAVKTNHHYRRAFFHLKKRVFPFKGNTRLTPRNNLFLLKEHSVSLKPDIKFFNM